MAEQKTDCSLLIDTAKNIWLWCLAILSGLMVWVVLERFDTGHLVLTEAGCLAVAAHGIETEVVGESQLCRLHAQFELPRRADRFSTIRAEGPEGMVEFELLGRYVVSVTVE